MFIITKIKFELTCTACPEQYNVFIGNDCVAYVRLRHGILSVNPCEGEDNIDFNTIIYRKIFEDGWKGEFTNLERPFYLFKVGLKVYRYLKRKRK